MGVDLKILARPAASTGRISCDGVHAVRPRCGASFRSLAADAVPCLGQPLPAGLNVGHYEGEGLEIRDGRSVRDAADLYHTQRAAESSGIG